MFFLALWYASHLALLDQPSSNLINASIRGGTYQDVWLPRLLYLSQLLTREGWTLALLRGKTLKRPEQTPISNHTIITWLAKIRGAYIFPHLENGSNEARYGTSLPSAWGPLEKADPW